MLWLIPAVLLVLGVVLYLLQDRLIFYPNRYPSNLPIDSPWQRIEFETGEGRQVAYYRGPENGAPEKLWLVFVGNASLALHWKPVADEVFARQPDFGFLLFDYPGYGESEGKPGRWRINRSVDASIESLAADLAVEVSKLKSRSAFLGQSLGAAVAFETAVRWESPEVVAISPFTSMKAMASQLFSPLVAPLARHRWDSEKQLDRLAGMDAAKVTIIHGDSDSIIPHAMGAELAERHADIVDFRTIPGAGHNDIFMRIADQLVEIFAAPAE